MAGHRHKQRRSSTPENTEQLYERALLADNRGECERAAALLRQALRQQPSLDILHGQMGNVLYHQGKYPEALASFEKALVLDPADPDHYNNVGNVLRALRRLDDAIRSYRHGISLNGRHAPLLINLGIVLNEHGDRKGAIAAYRQALALTPDSCDVLRNLANLLKEDGQADEALQLYEKLIDVDPDLAPAHLNLGVEYQRRGKLAEAVRCFEKVIAVKPEMAAAYNNLGNVLRLQQKIPEAIAALEKAIELDPDLLAAYNNLGTAWQADKKWDEALAAFEKARTVDPTNADAYNNTGNALASQEKFDEAWEWYEKAFALRPNFAEAENNMGNLLREQNKLDEALVHYERAIQLKPALADAVNNLGNTLKEQGRLVDSIAAYSRSIKLSPDNPGFRWNKSLADLTAGNLREGWEEYEWGFACKQRQPFRQFPQPRWNGESLTGKTILAWGEQGVGDEIMFSNCIPDLAAAADHCVVECDARLAPLFTRSFSDCEIVPRSNPPHPRTGWPDIDLQVPMGTMARWLRPTVESYPRAGGYLLADAARTAYWKQRLADLGPEMKVGISWRSRVMTANRRKLCAPLDQWGPILQTPGVQFINLQYCEWAEDLAEAERRFGVRVHHFEDLNLKDALDDVAALMSALDLTVTISNIAMTMGGALNTETWVFAAVGHMSWLNLGTDHAPWFPSVRLFHRTWDQTWEPVATAMAAELRERVRSSQRVAGEHADYCAARHR